MEKCMDYMDNSIDCIKIDDEHLPVLYDCDILTAADSFYHMDRTADFSVMIYVTDGIMYVTEGEKDYEIAPGELLFLKSGIRHFGRLQTPRGTRWFYSHFAFPKIQSDNALILPKKITSLLGSPVEEKIYTLCEFYHSPDSMKNMRKNALFYEILLDIVSEQKPRAASISDKICAFLDTQTDRDFSKELLKKQFFLSYSYLAAEFRKEKGVSMGQYHNAARMKKACHLLRSTLMSIGEIAAELGFEDMLYFSRKFHAFSGASPTAYRKQVQRKY